MEVKIPSVGESVSSGLISIWHKKDGEYVESGETLLTLDTDKVSTEIPAEESGTLKIEVPEGEEVEVGQVVAQIEPGEKPEGDDAETGEGEEGEPEPRDEGSAEAEDNSERVTEKEDRSDTDQAADEPGYGGRGEKEQAEGKGPVGATPDQEKALSPAVRRMVEENDLDPKMIEGTGPRGRITKQDVRAHLDARKEETSRRDSGKQPAREDGKAAGKAEVKAQGKVEGGAQSIRESAGKSGGSQAEEGERFTRKPMTPLRRKIAKALVSAQNNAAHLTTFNEADMSQVMALRKTYQDQFTKQNGIKLGFMSFFIKAAVEALKAVPQLNARIDGDDLILNHYYDIGVAVGTERGLVVPVIRDCDKKSFAQLEQDIIDYANKAREGKITLDDLQGGCFTISNGGIYGSMLSTPILNPPQSGILGMHNIQDRPIAVDGEVVIRPMMYLAMSYDHRVVDGKEAVTALVRVKECIEDPTRLALGV
jgi:2-oxoglutarate dehydrogenase E2 component (dihydrolipoamide succinyltransferase)